MPFETQLCMCGSLGVTELEWGAPDARMSCATHLNTAGAPVRVIFTPAPGNVTDLLRPANSFSLSAIRCESK